MKLHGWHLAAALPLLAACSHANQAPKAEAPTAAATTAPVEPAAPAAPAAATACTADEQCSADELCVSSKCVAITPDLAECRNASAHFDLDSASLASGDLPALRRAARCAAALPSETLLAEGNCDERGTAQYNVALGFRRANAVAKYIEALGVPAARVSEVSYGESRPTCNEATEACWAMNRRVDVSSGGQAKHGATRVPAAKP